MLWKKNNQKLWLKIRLKTSRVTLRTSRWPFSLKRLNTVVMPLTRATECMHVLMRGKGLLRDLIRCAISRLLLWILNRQFRSRNRLPRKPFILVKLNLLREQGSSVGNRLSLLMAFVIIKWWEQIYNLCLCLPQRIRHYIILDRILGRKFFSCYRILLFK